MLDSGGKRHKRRKYFILHGCMKYIICWSCVKPKDEDETRKGKVILLCNTNAYTNMTNVKQNKFSHTSSKNECYVYLKLETEVLLL